MGLKEQQNLLASLYTDAELFSRFTAEPESVAARYGLSSTEIRDLSALAGHEVRWYADSLFWKRFREVEKLLPTSSRVLSERFAALFREFSSRFNPKSVKKHLEDALAFADWILRGNHLDPLLADVLRFESTRLRHHAAGRRFSMCGLSHDVRPVFDPSWAGAGDDIPPRRRVAIWMNLGKRTRFYLL